MYTDLTQKAKNICEVYRLKSCGQCPLESECRGWRGCNSVEAINAKTERINEIAEQVKH
jgi:MoaA/NifB/PqqE/SkfB family radical SAM enzyme